MADGPTIVLRYFDARGRAQFIRHYLNVRKLAYSDERVPVAAGFPEWVAMRADRSRAGPFSKLPVLHWGTRTIAETLVIQSFLHRVTGDEALLSDEDNHRHAMLVSSLYNDVMLPIGTLIWADVAYPGVDVAALARASFTRIRAHLANLDRTLEDWEWTEAAADRPVMLADCLLWDQTDLLTHVFGEHVRLNELRTISRLYRESPSRAKFERALETHPAPATGRGLETEADVLARLRAAVVA